MSATILRYDPRIAGPETTSPAPRPQRGDGAVELAFAQRGGETVLADLYQRTPCRALFPRPLSAEPPVAVLLTTSGGLTGGDRIRVAATVRAGAAATVTSQAAEKIYRALASTAAEVRVALTVEEGGYLEYLPQETILFDGARLDRRTTATIAPGGRILACETVVLGRGARAERLTSGLLHDAWTIRCGERLAWADALRLEGDIAGLQASAAGFGGAGALATALYVGADARGHVETAQALAASSEGRGGASLVNGVIVARFLDPRPDVVRRDLMRYISALRLAVTGLPPTLPRVWHS